MTLRLDDITVTLGRGESRTTALDGLTAAVDRTRADDLTRLIVRTTHEHDCVTLVATHDPVVVEAADATIDMLDHAPAATT